MNSKFLFTAFFAILNHLSLILLPSDKNSNLDTMMANNEAGIEFRKKLFTNPLYVEAIRQWLPFYHNKGIFDFEVYK